MMHTKRPSRHKMAMAMSAPALLWIANSNGLALALLQVFLMLVAAFVLGRIAMRLKQPAVLGEILAGIVLGPTVFGSIAPVLHSRIYPLVGESVSILHAIAYLGLIAFVFTAGLQVDLACVRRKSHSTLLISVSGILLPFALGYGMVMLLPGIWGGQSGDLRIFALFMGTALSISALPVIARILMDLDLLKKELGAMIITAATIDDIVGWSLFALILSILNNGASLGLNLSLTIGALALTASIIYLDGKNGSVPLSRIMRKGLTLIRYFVHQIDK